MVLALGFTKLSILWFFRKIFVTHRRTVWDWITRVLTALVVAWTVAFFFVYAFECGNKPAAFWAPLAERVKHCFPINGAIAQFEKACGISDLVLDALCLSLPFPIVCFTAQLWATDQADHSRFGVSTSPYPKKLPSPASSPLASCKSIPFHVQFVLLTISKDRSRLCSQARHLGSNSRNSFRPTRRPQPYAPLPPTSTTSPKTKPSQSSSNPRPPLGHDRSGPGLHRLATPRALAILPPRPRPANAQHAAPRHLLDLRTLRLHAPAQPQPSLRQGGPAD